MLCRGSRSERGCRWHGTWRRCSATRQRPLMARRPVMIAPISEAVPGDRPPALVPRLWRRLTAAQRRDLAQLIARLLRSRLADWQRPSEAGHAEHAGGARRTGEDGPPSETRPPFRSAGCRPAKPPPTGGDSAAITAGWPGGL